MTYTSHGNRSIFLLFLADSGLLWVYSSLFLKEVFFWHVKVTIFISSTLSALQIAALRSLLSALRSHTGVVRATMFLILNMSLILNNLANLAESPICNTLIPFRLELPDEIDDSNDNKNEEQDDDDDDDDLSPMPLESEEADYTC
jgi:hypothetical protein